MPEKTTAQIEDLLSIPNYFLELERSAPFGYWIYDLREDRIWSSSALNLLLQVAPNSINEFRNACLGEEQVQACRSFLKAGKKAIQLNYSGARDVYTFEAELEYPKDRTELILVRHLSDARSPFTEDPLSYTYLCKFNAAGNYLFANKYYLSTFIPKGREIIGAKGLRDILEHSHEDCQYAVELAIQRPGSTIGVRLDKRGLDGAVLSTAWQFICLLEGNSNPVIYARGYDVSALIAAEEMVNIGQKELDIFFNNQVNGVFFMMLPEPVSEKKLQRDEALMQYVFDNLKISRANAVFLDHYGMSDESEVLGLGPKDFMEHDLEAGRKQFKEFFEKGRLHTLSDEQKIDGTPIKIEGDYLMLKNSQNQVLGLVGIQQDVTENFRQKEQVRNNVIQLQKLTENIPGIVFQLDVSEGKDLKLEFLSEAINSASIGIDKEQLLERPAAILDQISPKDYSTLLGSIIYAARNEEELDIEFRIENKLGDESWFKVSARPEKKKDGNGYSWFGIVHSIDAQKDFEKQQFKLAQIARSTSDLIMVIDAEGKVDWVNTSCLDYFNWKREEVLHQSPANLLIKDEESTNYENFLKELEGQRTAHYKLKLLVSEESRWLQVRNKPVWNANGEFLFSLVVMQDIDQEETKNIEMESLLNLTSEQNKRLQSFTYIISHNIRSHSANLQGLIDTIEGTEDQEEKDELWDYLRQVSVGLESTIKHLNEIIVINQSLNKNKQALNLKEEIDRVLQIVGREVQALGATLEYDFDPDQEVLAVKAYLESIIMNLITNALRYRHPDRKPVINISCKKEESLLFVRVKDNGLGIDLERYESRLFQLYQTFHNNPNSRGLGLYILKNQVESMGGEVGVKSTPGKGSTFSFGLPLDI